MILRPDSCDFYMLNTMHRRKPVKLTLKQEFNFNLSLIELIYLIIVKCIYNWYDEDEIKRWFLTIILLFLSIKILSLFCTDFLSSHYCKESFLLFSVPGFNCHLNNSVMVKQIAKDDLASIQKYKTYQEVNFWGDWLIDWFVVQSMCRI